MASHKAMILTMPTKWVKFALHPALNIDKILDYINIRNYDQYGYRRK